MPIGASIGAGVLGAGATIIGANTAAAAQTAAADKATDAQLKMFGITREALAPFIASGGEAAGRVSSNAANINKLLYGGGDDIQAELEKLPGYEFTRTQGLKAVQNSAAARGLGISGAAQKGAAEYATGLADKTYGDQVNRLLAGQDRDIAVEGIGANAAAGLGGNATQTGANVGSNAIGAGNAQAGAATSSANAIAGAGGDVAQALLLNKLLKGGGSTSMYNTGGLY